MTAILSLWRTILTPSPRREDGYTWAVIALGHVMLGAALAGLLDGLGAALVMSARLALSLAYWLAKEAGDLRRGGGLWDGLGDAAWVGVGLAYAGPWWWPVAVLAAVIVGAVLRQSTFERGADELD